MLERFKGCRPQCVVLLVLLATCRGTSIHVQITGDHDSTTERCTPRQAKLQALLFKGFAENSAGWSACPTQLWLDVYHRLSPSRNKTFVDIGCNKGYTSARLFYRWAPELGMAPATLNRTGCGACGDCMEDTEGLPDVSSLTHGLYRRPGPGAHDAGPVTVYCLEASALHHKSLVELKDDFPFQDRSSVWSIHHVAASDVSGSVEFTADCDTELCSMGAKDANLATTTVKAVSVDDFLAQEHIHHVDILKIDTEGFDPAVIKGAWKSLSLGHVSILYFEYHQLNLWGTTDLEDVVRDLSALHFACYLDGQPTLARLDAGCWDPSFEFKNWSNVVCVHVEAVPHVFTAFERLSFRAADFMKQA